MGMNTDMTDADSSSLFMANMDTPESSVPVVDGSTENSSSKPASSNSPPAAAIPTFPPPKTDKPRPHVCTTCMRSFARLEHLKRHERSHTKEKPFECPSCTRCFARRDLLLRHQQKLHSTTTPSSRPRNGRRESSNGVATGRVRKNSVASSTATTNMRPRANTLSHIDSSSMGMLASGSFGRQFLPLHSHHNSFNGSEANLGFGFRNLGTSHSQISGLPRLDTVGLPSDFSGGLRTAPPYAGFGVDFDIHTLGFDQDGGDTINPHALHVHNSSFSMDSSWDHSQHLYSSMHSQQALVEEDGFDWMTQGFENQMSFAHMNENAIDDSSPSAMSTNSPAHFQDLQNQTNAQLVEGFSASGMWLQPASQPQVVSSPLSMDAGALFGDMGPPTGETISPKSLLAQKGSMLEHGFPTPPDMGTIDSTNIAALSNGGFTLPFKHENVASTASTTSFDSSLRQSSVTTASSDLVNDHMRNILMAGLNQQNGFGQRKQSQPTISSPLSNNGGMKSKGFNAATFPSTQELQRYVSGYIKFFHPHLPFLHIATLNFESIEYATASSVGGYARYTAPNATSGGSCLLLSVAAMGALLIHEITHSKELFESAKRLIQTFLENRRQSQASKAQFHPHQRTDREDTPLWLVQAMLLNVIYGHNCGDKTAADIASNHCAALVSLARGAELAKPYPTYLHVNGSHDNTHNVPNLQNNVTTPEGWNVLNLDTTDSDWYEWKIMEERKRTLYAVFILSSMLVTAYNRAPALTNSEIRLDLPCDEELWAADSAHNWRVLGGASIAESRSVQFASALTHLLTAAQRLRRTSAQQMTGESWQNEESELKPSSFGCFVLINALHNYIWETRQRHLGRQWTIQELDSMHAHIEPALRAWQTAWRSNPIHSVERPNPFGAGPLSADSIPLLDLAYVRLFVDFGRSKEAYWQRDYDAMALELAKGSELRIVSQSTPSTTEIQNTKASGVANPISEVIDNLQEPVNVEGGDSIGTQASQRERHLRRAAFYAADHLLAADRLGLSLGEHTAQDLPLQSVLCACDSAQVLAEWMATVQERVGKYVGVLGRDEIDLMQIPSVMLLDDEDRKLIHQIQELLAHLETKRGNDTGLAEAREGGYGSRILVLTSETMARAAVWPVTKLMARSLEIQAGHVKARAIASVPNP